MTTNPPIVPRIIEAGVRRVRYSELPDGTIVSREMWSDVTGEWVPYYLKYDLEQLRKTAISDLETALVQIRDEASEPHLYNAVMNDGCSWCIASAALARLRSMEKK